MKLIKESYSKTLFFNESNLLKLVHKVSKEGRGFDGKFWFTFAPWVLFYPPTLLSKDPFQNIYAILIQSLISEVPEDENADNHILHGTTLFVFSNEDGLNEKDFMESILIEADNKFAARFYTHLRELEIKLKELDPITALILQDFDFGLLKLGSEYRPLQNQNGDYKEFFNV
jgi:hypothetical protein